MKEIGGYFGLELRDGTECHPGAIKLNSGSHALGYILEAQDIKKIYLPSYISDSLLKTIGDLGIEHEFYHINKDLELAEHPEPGNSEKIICVNYYGLKGEYISSLTDRYGDKIIVDNAQAFYEPPVGNIDTFYSPRKFFGVPDGGYLYTGKYLKRDLAYDVSFDSYTHLVGRIDRTAAEFLGDYRKNEKQMQFKPLCRMSKSTSGILKSIDYEATKAIRIENYSCLHGHLQTSNELEVYPRPSDVPMVYPYLLKQNSLRKKLMDYKIYVATYWPGIRDHDGYGSTEKYLVDYLLPLPVDQRYGAGDMEIILEALLG